MEYQESAYANIDLVLLMRVEGHCNGISAPLGVATSRCVQVVVEGRRVQPIVGSDGFVQPT